MSASSLLRALARRSQADERVALRESRRRRYLPLSQRVAGLNVLLVLFAVGVTVAVLAPRKLSALAIDEEVTVLIAAVALVGLANVYLVRRLVGPVQALTALARRVDLARPGQRIPDAEPTSEAGELSVTFNEMLARLEAERREATGRVLAAQEAERLRIAQELHDQVGQELTAVLLGLSRVQSQATDGLQRDVLALQDVVRASLEDVRRIAIELRPEALEELGLASALAVLAERLHERLGLGVAISISPDLPELAAEAELVIYRVAQEALTNVARHAGVDVAELTLAPEDGQLRLTVRDRGRGLSPRSDAGTGMRGMRERATLIGATLEIRNRDVGQGCEVRLDVPLDVPLDVASEVAR
jgi:two-component system sensor histidine kinase UhpB